MVAIFGGRTAKKRKIAGENRYFDRTYYLQLNNTPKWSNRDYESFAVEGYINNVIVHRAISMIARGVASVGLIYFEMNENGEKHELNDNDNVIALLKKPNPTSSYVKFIEQVVSSYLISGNVYIQAVKDDNNEIKEMYLLRSDRVSVLAGYGTIPAGYRYKINNMVFDFECDEDTGMSDILHIKAYHPLDDWYGLSPMEAAQYSIDQHNECVKWNKSLLENGARPCGALVVKQNMTDDMYNRLKSEMDDKLKGSDNSGKYMILEGGIEWKEMSINPKDMDFIETKNNAARDIASAFGVPPQMIGINGDNTYNNMAEARLTFWEDTIIPMTKMIVNAIADWYSMHSGRNIIIEPDLDTIQSLAEQRQKTWETINNSEFVSESEKRESLGFDEKVKKDNIKTKNNTKQ